MLFSLFSYNNHFFHLMSLVIWLKCHFKCKTINKTEPINALKRCLYIRNILSENVPICWITWVSYNCKSPEIITRKNRHHVLLKISWCQSYQTELLSLPKMTRSHAVSSFKSWIFDKSSHMSSRISPPLN